ncbi:MAG: hypothetical protein FWJ85_10420 [Solitalea sp.]
MRSLLRYCLILSALLFVSCGKDEDKFEIGKSGLTMAVDGQEWKSVIAYVSSGTHEDDDFHLVNIIGTKADIEDEDSEDAEAFSIMILIPNSKFNNPAGTYRIGGTFGEEEGDHDAVAYFSRQENGEITQYISFDPEEPSRVMGTVTIDQFKVGEQKFLGESLGMGYTELSGSFKVTLNTYVSGEDGYKTVELTNGKFSLNHGLNLGGLF